MHECKATTAANCRPHKELFKWSKNAIINKTNKREVTVKQSSQNNALYSNTTTIIKPHILFSLPTRFRCKRTFTALRFIYKFVRVLGA